MEADQVLLTKERPLEALERLRAVAGTLIDLPIPERAVLALDAP